MFLPGGADPEEVGFYLLAWAERRLGGTVDDDRTRVRVKTRSGKAIGLLVELVAVLPSGRRLEVFVETDEDTGTTPAPTTSTRWTAPGAALK